MLASAARLRNRNGPMPWPALVLIVAGCADFTAQGSYLGFLLTANPPQLPGAVSLTISETSGGTQVVEGGTGDSYVMTASTEPSHPITIRAFFDNTQLLVDGQGSSPLSITLSANCPGAECWSSGRTVTVSAVNDAVTEGLHTSLLTHTSTSADPQYDGLSVAGLSVSVKDRRRIFVTASAVLPPNIGLAALDAACQASGNRPTSDTYKALLAASTRRACVTANCGGGAAEHLAWVLQPGTSYYQGDGVTAIGQTTAAAGIFTFPLVASWTGAGASHTWTGLNADWTSAADSCLDWSSLAGNGGGGAFGFTSSGAIDGGPRACAATWPSLICVAQ